MIPVKIFEDYQKTLITDGFWNNEIWFVTRQTCCDTKIEKDAQERLDMWNKKGQPEGFDIQDIHPPNHCFFNKINGKYCIQRTWIGLIKVLFGYYGIKYNSKKYYEFQANHWGREKNRKAKFHQALTGLLPLGRSNTGEFRDYTDTWYKWTGLDYMKNSDTYERRWLTYRIEKFKQNIQIHKPRVVIFYTKTHTDAWNEIADCNFRELENTDNSITECPRDFSAEFYQKNGTLYVNMASPVAFGACNNYFEAIGEKIFDFVGHRNLGKI